MKKKKRKNKLPDHICQKYEKGYRIGLKDYEIYAFGKTKKETYLNFKRYLRELIFRLENDKKLGELSVYMVNVLNYLLNFSNNKVFFKEPRKIGKRIVFTVNDRKYLNSKFPPEK